MKSPAGLKNVAVIAMLFATSTAFAWEGPFGLQKGLSFEQINKVVPLVHKRGTYTANTVPVPNEAFDDYMLQLTPRTGLCKVTAFTPLINGFSFGDAVKEKFDRLKTSLTAKYGQPAHDFDFLKAGSIWNDRRDWMTAVYRKERTVAAYWTNQKTSLPNELSVIALTVLGVASDKAFVTLSYEFVNFEECSAIRDTSAAGL